MGKASFQPFSINNDLIEKLIKQQEDAKKICAVMDKCRSIFGLPPLSEDEVFRMEVPEYDEYAKEYDEPADCEPAPVDVPTEKKDARPPVVYQKQLFRISGMDDEWAKCFSEIYAKFFGHGRSEELKGDCSPLDFSIYLFLIVAKTESGRVGFFENGKKPFYRFITERGICDIKETYKTFLNRFNKMKGTVDAIMKTPFDQEGFKETIVSSPIHGANFTKVFQTFLNCRFVTDLKRQVKVMEEFCKKRQTK